MVGRDDQLDGAVVAVDVERRVGLSVAGLLRPVESVVERVVVLSRSGVIRTADLPPHICTVSSTPPASSASLPPRSAIATW